MLMDELLEKGYDFILTSRFQSDPVELRFSKCRQMSGGRFLVNILEVKSSGKIVLLTSIMREEINFWEENVKREDQTDLAVQEIEEKISDYVNEVLEVELSDDTKEIAAYISGFIVKKMLKNKNCKECSVAMKAKENTSGHDRYLQLLSRGGVICPSLDLHDFVCQAFSILDWLSPYLKGLSGQVSIRKVTKLLLGRLMHRSANFTCSSHMDCGKDVCFDTIINIYYNNRQRI